MAVSVVSSKRTRDMFMNIKYILTGGDYNRWGYSNGYVNSPAWHVPFRVNQVRNVMVHATPRTLTNRFLPAYPEWGVHLAWGKRC